MPRQALVADLERMINRNPPRLVLGEQLGSAKNCAFPAPGRQTSDPGIKHGEVRQLVEVKLNVVSSDRQTPLLASALTNLENTNDINTPDQSTHTTGRRREMRRRASLSNSGQARVLPRAGGGGNLAGGPR